MLTDALHAACRYRPNSYVDWQAWLTALQVPLSPIGEGQELTGDPRFTDLKQAVAAMTETDFGELFSRTSKLIEHETKDLRLAAYLLPTASHEYGVEGLLMALALFNQLLIHRQVRCFPHKSKGRLRLHQWMLGQQTRILAFLINQAPCQLHLTELSARLATYGELAREHLDPEAGSLSQLNDWVSEQLANGACQDNTQTDGCQSNQASSRENGPCVESANTDAQLPVSPPANIVARNNAEPVIDSEADFRCGIAALLTYDREQQQFRRMMLLARASRWGAIQLPVGNETASNIPAPRARALAPVSQALLAGQGLQAFLLAEKLFMEGTLHFCLDLQRLCHQALKAAELPSLGKLIEQQLVFWLSLYPAWQGMRYDDGTVMAEQETRAWLKTLESKAKSRNTAGAESPASSPIVTGGESALAWAEKGQLGKALACIDALPLSEPRALLYRQLLQARACLAAERPAWARPIIRSLVEQVECHQLGRWWPSLATSVWRTCLECYGQLLPHSSADEQRILTQQINLVREQLLLSSPAGAAEWLSMVDD